MNWFVLGNALLYAGAAVWSIEKGNYLWGLVWLFYGGSCALLAALEMRT